MNPFTSPSTHVANNCYVNTAYQALEKGEIIKLPDKTDSFQYWAREQKEYAKSKKVYREMEYWKNILAANTMVLPGDVEIGEIKNDHKDNIHCFEFKQTWTWLQLHDLDDATQFLWFSISSKYF